MKKTFSIFALAAAVLCSCDKNADCIPCQEQDTPEPAMLNVSLDFGDELQTRSVTAYTTAQDYEKAVNSVQILVFDESGKINIHKNAGTSTSSIEISTTAGTKTVWAIVNADDLSGVASISELKGKAIDLSGNSLVASEGFVMSGSNTCALTSDGGNVEIEVSRLVSRVALQSVKNQLPEGLGTLQIKNVTLSNVVGNYRLDGTGVPSSPVWYNQFGREDAATQGSIIDGVDYNADCEDLTFVKTNASLENGDAHGDRHLFYCYPNSTTTDQTGWASSFTARKTRLVVTASILGVKYYYPVTLDTPERNKAYTVELTITGLGSTDPDEPVSKGAITASVSVKDWEAGATYEETI